MECPKCFQRMKTMDSRAMGNWRWRRYKCLACNRLYYTEEKIFDSRPVHRWAKQINQENSNDSTE